MIPVKNEKNLEKGNLLLDRADFVRYYIKDMRE